MPYHFVPFCTVPSFVIPLYATLCYTIPCYFVPYYIVPHHLVPYHIVQLSAILPCVILLCAILCHATLCNTTLCYVGLYQFGPYHFVSHYFGLIPFYATLVPYYPWMPACDIPCTIPTLYFLCHTTLCHTTLVLYHLVPYHFNAIPSCATSLCHTTSVLYHFVSFLPPHLVPHLCVILVMSPYTIPLCDILLWCHISLCHITLTHTTLCYTTLVLYHFVPFCDILKKKKRCCEVAPWRPHKHEHSHRVFGILLYAISESCDTDFTSQVVYKPWVLSASSEALMPITVILIPATDCMHLLHQLLIGPVTAHFM